MEIFDVNVDNRNKLVEEILNPNNADIAQKFI